MAKDWTKTKAYRELKQEMLDDLEARGLISRPDIDKVEEYMELWAQLKMLNADIKERGVSIEYQNGENQKGTTDNNSCFCTDVEYFLGARLPRPGCKSKSGFNWW